MRDGEVLVAIEKERLTRSKHATGYSGLQDVVRYCLDFAGVALPEVDHIVVQDATHRLDTTLIDPREVRIGHHTAHAWAAMGLSGFEEAAILVIDCEGSFLKELPKHEVDVCTSQDMHCAEKESAYVFKEGLLLPVRKWTSSVCDGIMTGTEGMGAVYWFLSQLIFGRDAQDSKVMGMAAYGKPTPRYKGVMQASVNGDILFNKDWIFLLDSLPRCRLDQAFEEYAALTATVQQELEQAILHKARWLREETGSTRLCYAGGVALNCVANSKLVEAQIFDEVFVPFGAGDSSISIGCAYYAHRMLGQGTNERRWAGRPPAFLGRAYCDEEVQEHLGPFLAAGLISKGEPCDADVIAEELAEGAIVGWFQDRGEFGPRALGNRSLLADPRRADVREVLNRKVKLREPYRPFGASVLEEHVKTLFEDLAPGSEYMQFVGTVRPSYRHLMQSVIHRDGSTRPQVVNAATNPKLHSLLCAFYRRTGVPALLNTSFNISEPIVEAPRDALKCFVCSGIDQLVIGTRRFFRMAALVGSEIELEAAASADLRIVFHHDLELVRRPNGCFVQPLTGRDVYSKEGHRVHQYAVDERSVSRALFEALSATATLAHSISDCNSPLVTDLSLRREVFVALHQTRVISFVRHTPAGV